MDEIEALRRKVDALQQENDHLRNIIKDLRQEMMLMKPMSELELFERSFKDPQLKAYLKKNGFFERMNSRGKLHR